MTPKPEAYVICTSPRSGSTLLCRMLAATGAAGCPDSHFHTPSRTRWAQHYGLPESDFTDQRDRLRAIFRAAIAQGRGQAGPFGLRMQRHSFDYFMQQTGILYPGLTSDRERISAAFGRTRFIYLSRAGKLEQAISYVIASQSGLWHRASDGAELERLSPPRVPVYDAAEIARQMAELTAQDNAWTLWFRREGLRPMRLGYEQLAQDPGGTLARVLAELGLDPALADPVMPPVARLSDAINREWAARFTAETRGQPASKL